MVLSTAEKLQKHLQAAAKILDREAEVKELESLAGIEKIIRAPDGAACRPVRTNPGDVRAPPTSSVYAHPAH